MTTVTKNRRTRNHRVFPTTTGHDSLAVAVLNGAHPIRTKLRAGALGLTLLGICAVVTPVYAQETSQGESAKPAKASKQENIGVATGFAVGAAAGGPVGAMLGAAAGAWLGDRYHKQATSNQALQADLTNSETERSRLAQNLAELNGSLAESKAWTVKLKDTLVHTDQLETDVGFRTNDTGISTQALSPLMTLGALAAAMPDVKVRVAGYADPRGSDAVNDALSLRRAEAVATVLERAGVGKDQIIVEGHGKTESVSREGDLEGYAFDRRVTVRLERAEAQKVASR